MRSRLLLSATALTAIAGGLVACAPTAVQQRVTALGSRQISYPAGVFVSRPTPSAAAAGIAKIKHVVIITQENHSFDNYFGTYPGADDLLDPGAMDVCLPDPDTGLCVSPTHTTSDVSAGGPHGHSAAVADIDDGQMDGFVEEADASQSQCNAVDSPACTYSTPDDVMDYYDQHEIPNYWSYAKHYVLQDHFFESAESWSFPQHLYMVSGWSAKCATHNPMSCKSNLGLDGELRSRKAILAWTDITFLLHAYGVSWRYYVERGQSPDCLDAQLISCKPTTQSASKASIWNPLPQFDTVKEDAQLHNVQVADKFFTAAKRGTLPSVSWVVPAQIDSEHAPARVSDGQAWVTSLVNAVMKGPDWKSTAIFINWDDWGGLYDQLDPPDADKSGFGVRVPALIISPWAKAGRIDHQTLSTDAYLKFIEDRWLDGQALNPRTDGRPDARTTVREDNPRLGNLLKDFDFNQTPLPRDVLKTRPTTDLTEPLGYPPPTQPCTAKCGVVPPG